MKQDQRGALERLAARLGMTEGQLWTVAIMVVTIALLLYGLRNIDPGALS